MSVLPKESIKILAEQAGITNLSDEVAAAMVSDVEYRLREVIQESLKFMKHAKRSKLTTEDINDALRLRNVESLYGYSGTKSLSFRRVAGTTDLFFVDDKVLSFEEIFQQPLPKTPRDTTFTAHWLAIEGVQPATRHNPPPREDVVELGKKRKDRPTKVKDLVQHTLSRELQLYYEKVTQAITGSHAELLETALSSIANDPGINQLLPYFTQFIADEVTQNLRNLKRLFAVMRMVSAILNSPYLHVEPYLHQLMPSILTCLVGRWLCKQPTENHWELRDYSAELVATICSKFGGAYQNLQPRVTKTLLHAFLDPKKPLTTHYGAIVGLSKLGPNVIQVLLLPNIGSYVRMLTPILQEQEAAIKQLEAQKCHDALLRAVGIYLQQVPEDLVPVSKSSDDDDDDDGTDSELAKQKRNILLPGIDSYMAELREIFGEQLTPYLPGQGSSSSPSSSSSSAVAMPLL